MWQPYFEQTKNNPPSKYLTQAVQILGRTGTALDLGSGGGRDTRFLIQQGFIVTAVDAAPDANTYIADLKTDDLHFVYSAFENFSFDQYDLINSSYSLPFVKEADFPMLWQNIRSALNPGGIFVGELFGAHDSWNNFDGQMNFHTRQDVEQLLAGLKVHDLIEEEDERPTASGDRKHWHAFHIIAQKP